jgi:asparagine synthase (glutamine-hydrolysing)
MGQTLVHRGPDDQDQWVDASVGIGLAHQRLSIVDLSTSGRQPMASASSRHVLVFNGEIYNHMELRDDLTSKGVHFRGHSDTETLVEAIDHWGLPATLERANGMFALAVWDRTEQRLCLARDRMGIKPLYYGWLGNQFAFGSELKALVAHPAFDASIDRTALCSLVQHSYIAAPLSIYQDIFKLLPGHWLAIDANGFPGELKPARYWSLKEVVQRGGIKPFGGTTTEAIDQLDQLLADAVRLRQMSDVPLGAYLSGGIDSSTVAALMQRQLDRPARTFAIGFDEPKYNEANYARRVAEHLGTEHIELYVSPHQAREVIPRLPALYDEPFADSSQIPTFLVSQLARQHVTVALSGDGGDELFGGYHRYALTDRIWRRIGWLHPDLRKLCSPLLTTVGTLLNIRKVQTLGRIIGAKTARHVYHHTHTHWEPRHIVVDAKTPQTVFTRCEEWAGRSNLTEELMAIDSETYLPDDILTKVDRASMGVGLEARVPLLDHRVVEFAWSLPLEFKVRAGETKWLLRQVLDRYVPRPLIDRPKVGFGVPIDAWLRGPLREWAEELLSATRLKQDEFFMVGPIRAKWQQHLEGTHDWHYYLWDILMFQAWNAAQRAS